MREEARNHILWLGAAPAEEWLDAARHLALGLRPVPFIPDDESLSCWRCIVINMPVLHPPTLLRNLKACFPAMEAGVAVFVLSPGADLSLRTQFALYVDDFVRDHRLFGTFRPLSCLHLDSASLLPLFQRCIAHDPGPHSSRSPIIEGDATIIREDFTLLQRVFGNYSRIRLERQGGGRSTAGAVWCVTATIDSGHDPVPYVVKCGPRAVIEQEHAGYEAFVRPYVDFSHRPARIKDGWVRGRSRAALAATFVPESLQLGVLLLKGGDPAAVIRKLRATMSRWRGRQRLILMSPGQHYVDDQRKAETRRNDNFPGQTCEVLPKLDDLVKTFHLCNERGLMAEAPDRIWHRLQAQPKDVYPWCIGHGDLNCRNVMVRPNGELVLIDFSHCDQMLASRDLARLEVNLAFDVPKSVTSFLSDEQLCQFYRSPLLGREVDAASDCRLRAANELRKIANEEGIKEGDYAISVACHLLRFSRHRVGADGTAAALEHLGEQTRLRLVAYHAASALVRLHCGDSSEEGST